MASGEAFDVLADELFELLKSGKWRTMPLGEKYVSLEHVAAETVLAVAQVRLNLMPYEEYLKTEHWAEISAEAKKRAGNACQLCNASGTTLDVHHRTYERRGFERLDDLTVLCRQCHAKFHDKQP